MNCSRQAMKRLAAEVLQAKRSFHTISVGPTRMRPRRLVPAMPAVKHSHVVTVVDVVKQVTF